MEVVTRNITKTKSRSQPQPKKQVKQETKKKTFDSFGTNFIGADYEWVQNENSLNTIDPVAQQKMENLVLSVGVQKNVNRKHRPNLKGKIKSTVLKKGNVKGKSKHVTKRGKKKTAKAKKEFAECLLPNRPVCTQTQQKKIKTKRNLQNKQVKTAKRRRTTKPTRK